MPHPRKLIRDALKAQLLSQTAAGARVFTTRFIPLRPNQLPAILIYTLEEAVDPSSVETAPRELKRTMDMIVELVIKSTDQIVVDNGGNIDEALDAFADQVERRISINDTMSGFVSDVVYMGVDPIEVDTTGDQPMIYAPLRYRGIYYRYAPEAEDVPPEDFSTADIRYSLSGEQHPDDQAHDVLENLEA